MCMVQFLNRKENQQLRMQSHYVPGGSLNFPSPNPRRAPSRVRKHQMDSLRFTYADLRTELSRQISAGIGPAASSEPNLNSALTGFLQDRGIPESDVIASTLRASFYKNLTAHLTKLREQGRSGPYISNRKNHLAHWRKCLLEADRSSSSKLEQASPFQKAIQELIARGSTVTGTSRATGVPHCTLKRWLKGAAPNRISLKWVPRLEFYFAVPTGTLLDLVPQGVHTPPRHQLEAALVEYRERQKANNKLEYAIKEPCVRLRREWAALLAYKTSITKAVRRPMVDASDRRCRTRARTDRLAKQRAARWSTTPLPIEKRTEKNWYAFQGESYVATASICWTYVAQFLGWLTLSAERGGLGFSREAAETLANLTRDDLIEEYIQWRVERAGGIHHNGVKTWLTFIRGLCNPETGYLTQSFEQFRDLGLSETDEEWREDCKATYNFVIEVAADVANVLTRSRDPFKAIGPALELANPLDAIADAIARLDADRPTTGGVQEAVWARDRLLIKLLASNPLRDKNIRMLKFQEGDEGNLRKVNGEWRISIPRHEFKNAKGAAKNRSYDMPVRKEVWGDIERYLRDYRPQLASPANPYLFVSSVQSDGPWYSLRRRFAILTRAYMAGCPGVGPHAMRHIVATSILKQRPNDWAAAAWALHDLEETVKKHYVHLRSDDAERWMGPAMDAPFSRM